MTDAITTNEAAPKTAASKKSTKTAKTPKPKTPKVKAAKPAKARATKAVKSKVAKSSKPKEAKTGMRRRRKATDVIHVLTESRANPRRAGTDAHAHFEIMKKSKTVGAYLAQFAKGDERGNASQWLWNTVRDGWVELVPGEE